MFTKDIARVCDGNGNGSEYGNENGNGTMAKVSEFSKGDCQL